MAEAKATKEKKVTEREKFMYEAAQLFMEQMDLDAIYRTKEGLLFNRGEEQVVVKFIQKKAKVHGEDVVETINRVYDFVTMDATEVADEDELYSDEAETAEVAM